MSTVVHEKERNRLNEIELMTWEGWESEGRKSYWQPKRVKNGCVGGQGPTWIVAPKMWWCSLCPESQG